jgi:hypothetical protein
MFRSIGLLALAVGLGATWPTGARGDQGMQQPGTPQPGTMQRPQQGTQTGPVILATARPMGGQLGFNPTRPQAVANPTSAQPPRWQQAQSFLHQQPRPQQQATPRVQQPKPPTSWPTPWTHQPHHPPLVLADGQTPPSPVPLLPPGTGRPPIPAEDYSNNAYKRSKTMTCQEILDEIRRLADHERRSRNGTLGLLQRLRNMRDAIRNGTINLTHIDEFDKQLRALKTMLWVLNSRDECKSLREREPLSPAVVFFSHFKIPANWTEAALSSVHSESARDAALTVLVSVVVKAISKAIYNDPHNPQSRTMKAAAAAALMMVILGGAPVGL